MRTGFIAIIDEIFLKLISLILDFIMLLQMLVKYVWLNLKKNKVNGKLQTYYKQRKKTDVDKHFHPKYFI